MVNRKKFGDWNDPNNKYVKLIPYWDLFNDNYSISSITPIFLELVKFALYCKDQFKIEILDAQGKEILLYFKTVINQRSARKSAKKRVRYFLSSYYEYIKNYKKDIEGIKFKNPVPSTKIYDFDDKSDTLKDLEQEFHLLTMDQVKRIIAQVFYTKNYWLFIAICLIIFTGARVREIVQIQLININLKERWLLTNVKSRKSDKRIGIYFIPQFFIQNLKEYIEKEHLKYPDSKLLFYSSCSKAGHKSKRAIQRCLAKVKNELGFHALTNPHAFRDFINSRWEEKGCSKVQRKFLLNQKNPDVNINHYLKKYKNRLFLRSIYDKFNPFNKKILPNPRI